MIRKQFPIIGMHCASCAKLIERKLNKVDGIVRASVNYANEIASIEMSKNVTDESIEEAVISAGYRIGKDIEKEKEKRINILKYKVIYSIFVSLVLMALMFLDLPNLMLLALLLALTVQIWAGLEFYQATWSGIKNYTTSMDTLVVIGTTAGILGGYYETSVTIIALILLGRYLETRSKSKTSNAIKSLLGLQSKEAFDLKINDLVSIKPGQKVLTDGVIVEGSSYIDQSMVTGESVPVKKTVGDHVIGGTINKNGSFVFKVTKLGKDTVLSQIIKMVSDAQGSRAEIQKLVDIVSSYFIPVVLFIAIITFFIFGLTNAIAVLVIACPCAMGLATPTAIVVGVGRGAQMGILIKDVRTLEILNRIKTIIFDKTGTLTIGHPILTNKVDDKYMKIAASLESYSSHPIAEAIKYKKLFKVKNFKNIEGKGIEGVINNIKYFIGKSKFGSVTLMSNNKLLATFVIEDQIKPNVKEVIKSLESKGIDTWMISGDNKKTAQKVANEVGIKNVMAEVMPQDKANKVKEFKNVAFKVTKCVAFVGDGVNDAPALASADVGIAMGTGTDIAIESAGVTLINKDFRTVIKAINLSRATMNVIKSNLVWAFGYNIILIPVAAFGLLNPMFAAGAMSLSSISVVLNSLRLNRVRV
jgi:Cu+-exporting ATPase